MRFTGTDGARDGKATAFAATLTLLTDGYGAGKVEIDLAGLAQNRSELGEEPTVAQVVAAFGYGTDMAQGLLADGGRVETVGDEVLAPYLRALDATKPVEIIQIGSFLQQTNVARFGVHGLDGAAVTELFAQDDQQGQTVSPDGLVAGAGDTGSVARASFSAAAPFGLRIEVDGRPTFAAWSDPVANRADPTLGTLVGADRGHLIRLFEARDAGGALIAGTYIGIQDYAGGGNYDYNDHMFLIRNVAPHALTATEDANGDGALDALQRDADGDGLVAFFDPDDAASPVAQAPFNPTQTPWRVSAETGLFLDALKFDQGDPGEAWFDATPAKLGPASVRPDAQVDVASDGKAIGHVDDGEWVEYTISVDAAGQYDLSFFAATPWGGRAVAASFIQNGAVYESAVAATPRSDWTDYAQTAPTTVSLRAGEQVLRVSFEGEAQNLRALSLLPAGAQTVTVFAGGSGDAAGAPLFEVYADGALLGAREIFATQSMDEIRDDGVDYAAYVFAHAGPAPSRVEIRYLNDSAGAPGAEDLNLFVDKVVFGGRSYESETEGDFQHWADRVEVEGPREELYWNGVLSFEAGLA